MKYCPKCGALLDGKFECSCGFVIDEEELKENPGSNTIGVVGTGMMNPYITEEDIKFEEFLKNSRLDNNIKEEDKKTV